MGNFQNILEKLVAFKKKFYQNQLLKGLILGIAGALFLFLCFAVLEYYGRFSTGVRTVFFYSYLAFAMYLLGKYVALPVYHLSRANQSMSNEEASTIVGRHFPEIEDKLLNALQLRQLYEGQNDAFLLASIEQKTSDMRPLSFASAVNFSDNKRYLKYLALPVLLLGVILLFQSNIIVESSQRIVQHNKVFETPAPFSFHLGNKDLDAVLNKPFQIDLHLKGSKIPTDVFLMLDGNPIKMKKQKANVFSYQIENVTKAHAFYFQSGEFHSGEHALNVLPNPTLLRFTAQMVYPGYTGLKSEVLQNVGDLEIPEGTYVTWKFNTKEVSDVLFITGGQRLMPLAKAKNQFSFKKRILQGTNYSVQLKNDYISNSDTSSYHIQVIKDQYPNIAIEQKQDSSQVNSYYFFGKAKDDYGINKITFNYKYLQSAKDSVQLGKTYRQVIERGSGTDKAFYYHWDAQQLNIGPSDHLEYYFEVWDNDAVHGSKSARSKKYSFRAPSQKELKEKKNEQSDKAKSALASARKEAQRLQEKTKELQKSLSNIKQLTWQDKQKVNKLIEEQKQLEKKLEDLKKQTELNQKEQNQYKKPNEELLNKQKQLKKLMDEVMTPEMKELYKKLEELLKKNNKEEIKKHLEKMEFGEKEMEKQLDRALEQMKQMEVEQKWQEAIDKLEELEKKQKDLAQKTENKELKKEEISAKQEALKQEFEDLKKDLQDVKKKNEALENPMKLDTEKKLQNETDQKMEDAKSNAQKGKNSKSSADQEDAAENMEKMKESLQEQKDAAEEEQNEEDYQTLRAILENLIQLSFDQEDLLVEFKSLREYNPKYIELSQNQKKIVDDSKIIEDSLFALSKRNPFVAGFINKEVGKMNVHMNSALDYLKKRLTYRAVRDQQYAMTNMNNLAVMLSESLEQMQQEMKKQQQNKNCKNPGKKSGKKQCNNPGKKPGKKVGDVKSQQQKLSKMLSEMKKQMEGGKKPSSKDFAKMAAEQEAMRRALQQLEKELNEQGKGGKLGDLKKTEELMDQQEDDLVNKRLNAETMRRNKEILTRLLEHERAEKEQDTEETREANEGDDATRRTPPEIKKYLEKIKREQELLKTVPANLKPYYKQKVKEYYREIGG